MIRQIKRTIKSKLFELPSFISLSLFFLLLIILINNVFAQTSSPVNNTIHTLRAPPWEIIVIFVLFINLSIVSLAFMFSKVFDIKELGGWAKNELYQVIMMAFIVFLVFSAIKIENIVFEAYGFVPTPENPNGAIENAKQYLSSVRIYVTSVVTSAHTFNVLLNLGKNKISNVVPSIPFFEVNEGIYSIFKSASDMVKDVILASTSVLGLTTLQIYFLDLIERLAFTLILPLGLFFRVFSFTRSVGNFLIVIAISFYIVYPLTFLLNQSMVDALLNKPEGWKDILGVRSQDTAFGTFSSNLLTTLKDDTNSIFNLSETSANLFERILLIRSFIDPLALFTEATFAFLLFTIIPILDFTITIVIAKELGSFFGSDVDFTTIMKQL